ncbi:GmCK3p, putative [Anopheles sinensis]|uniref:GmCK3p, putative n=1 Tax=Anopheles sinensis TaxID=74873 RepID=A0A084VYV3_ANOSI|nr:GmCK3p, putative [Anopheles sinensis]
MCSGAEHKRLINIIAPWCYFPNGAQRNELFIREWIFYVPKNARGHVSRGSGVRECGPPGNGTVGLPHVKHEEADQVEATGSEGRQSLLSALRYPRAEKCPGSAFQDKPGNGCGFSLAWLDTRRFAGDGKFRLPDGCRVPVAYFGLSVTLSS